MASITAIEFTDLECKVVHVDRAKERAVLRAMFYFSLPKNEDAASRVTQRAKLLRDALRTHKIKPQRVHVVIPKNYVMARMVTLPSTSEQEIAGMARFEAERHIPFNAERHIVHFHILSKLGVQGSQVLLAAVDQPIAQEYLDVCLKAGLSVEQLGVSSLAMYNAFAFGERAAMPDKVVAVVNVGHACTDLVIVNNGMLCFTRGSSLGVGKLFGELAEADAEFQLGVEDLPKINALEPQRYFRPQSVRGYVALEEQVYGAEHTPLGEQSLEVSPEEPTPASATLPENKGATTFSKWLLRLLQEVRRTYDFAHREFNLPAIDRIYVCGEGALIANLAQYFQVNFGIESTVFDPLRAMEVPARLARETDGQGVLFSGATGAVMPEVPETVRINLLPEAYVEKRHIKRQQQSYFITGALALTALVLAYFYVADLFASNQRLLDMYMAKNKEYKERVADLQDRKQRYQIIKDNIQDPHGALDIFEKISSFEFIPKKVTLTSFDYKKEESVKIEGNAKTIKDINDMETALKATNFFDSVQQDQGSVASISLRGREQQVFKFSITCVLPKLKTEMKKSSTASKPSKTAAEEE